MKINYFRTASHEVTQDNLESFLLNLYRLSHSEDSLTKWNILFDLIDLNSYYEGFKVKPTEKVLKLIDNILDNFPVTNFVHANPPEVLEEDILALRREQDIFSQFYRNFEFAFQKDSAVKIYNTIEFHQDSIYQKYFKNKQFEKINHKNGFKLFMYYGKENGVGSSSKFKETLPELIQFYINNNINPVKHLFEGKEQDLSLQGVNAIKKYFFDNYKNDVYKIILKVFNKNGDSYINLFFKDIEDPILEKEQALMAVIDSFAETFKRNETMDIDMLPYYESFYNRCYDYLSDETINKYQQVMDTIIHNLATSPAQYTNQEISNNILLHSLQQNNTAYYESLINHYNFFELNDDSHLLYQYFPDDFSNTSKDNYHHKFLQKIISDNIDYFKAIQAFENAPKDLLRNYVTEYDSARPYIYGYEDPKSIIQQVQIPTQKNIDSSDIQQFKIPYILQFLEIEKPEISDFEVLFIALSISSYQQRGLGIQEPIEIDSNCYHRDYSKTLIPFISEYIRNEEPAIIEHFINALERIMKNHPNSNPSNFDNYLHNYILNIERNHPHILKDISKEILILKEHVLEVTAPINEISVRKMKF